MGNFGGAMNKAVVIGLTLVLLSVVAAALEVPESKESVILDIVDKSGGRDRNLEEEPFYCEYYVMAVEWVTGQLPEILGDFYDLIPIDTITSFIDEYVDC